MYQVMGTVSFIVSVLLYNTQELRHVIWGFIANNWTQWEQKIALHHNYHNNFITKKAYIARMVNAYGWAASPEIEASLLLACKLQQDI